MESLLLLNIMGASKIVKARTRMLEVKLSIRMNTEPDIANYVLTRRRPGECIALDLLNTKKESIEISQEKK